LVEGTPFGRYRFLELVGRGGMGEVWKAFDTVTERVVAVKVLPGHLADNQEFQQRFMREARAAAGLNEPHVVPIHYFGEIDGRLYVDMRLIDGQDLETVLTDGPLEPARAVLIIGQIAAALDAAHRVGLVHRDVKPSNVLIAEDDFAYLIDFGIARAVGETGLTSTGTTIGTWAYMAPERFSTGQADPRSDVYSLACVLHQCVTGQRPYPGDSLEQQVAGHLMTAPPKPSELRERVPAPLDEVIACGMAKNPDERYQSTKELAHAASTAITLPTPPRQPSPPAQPPTQAAFLQPNVPSVDHETARHPSSVSPSAATQLGPSSAAVHPTERTGHALPEQHRKALWRYRIVLPAVIVVFVLIAAGLFAANEFMHRSAAGPARSTGPTVGATSAAEVGPATQVNGSPNQPHGPDTCLQGFVWREARPGDDVCVTPEVRDRTAQENTAAAARRDPNGGAYGPNTCVQGYVWREAYDGDQVCVTPDIRDEAHADNATADARKQAKNPAAPAALLHTRAPSATRSAA
jgi:serine/threonine protein kinase